MHTHSRSWIYCRAFRIRVSNGIRARAGSVPTLFQFTKPGCHAFNSCHHSRSSPLSFILQGVPFFPNIKVRFYCHWFFVVSRPLFYNLVSCWFEKREVSPCTFTGNSVKTTGGEQRKQQNSWERLFNILWLKAEVSHFSFAPKKKKPILSSSQLL